MMSNEERRPRLIRILHALHLLVLWPVLLGLAATAYGERPVGLQIGGSKSAIVDEQNQVVGAGPTLAIHGPGSPQETLQAGDARQAALYWFAAFMESYAILERDLAVIKMALRANFLAIRELEADLAADRATLANARGDKLRSYMQLLVNAKEPKLAELKKEQEALLRSALERWRDFSQCLEEKIAECKAIPEAASALGKFSAFLAKKRTVGEMELYLQAGKSAEFRAVADRAERDPELQAIALHLRVQDYLDRGQMGMALYAARVGSERYEKQPLGVAMGEQARDLDVAFLKMISDKADRTVAEIRRVWQQYAGDVGDGFVKQFVFGSMRHGLDTILRRPNYLRDLAADSQDRVVLERNGIEVVWRFREKGLSFDDIRLMTPDKMRDTWQKVFNRAISSESAEAMTVAVQAAFQNADVKNLVWGGRQAMAVDLRPKWMGEKEFDAGWFGTCTDAINVKNVALLCGPGVVVSSSGAGAGLSARFAKAFGGGSNAWQRVEALMDTGLKGGVTFRDWLASTPSLKQAASFLAKTNTGKALREGLNTWCAARYQGPTAVRRVMAAEEVMAQLVVFEAGGKIGKAIGGQYGEFFGQALAVLAGNPIHDFQQARVAAITKQVKEFRAALRGAEEAAAKLKQAQTTLEQAGRKVVEGQPLTPAEQAAAQEARQTARLAGRAAQDAESLAQQAAAPGPGEPGVVQAGANRTVRGAQEQAEVLEGLADAVASGDAAGADIAGQMARKGGQRLEQAVGEAKQAEAALQNAANKPPSPAPPPETPPRGPAGDPIEVTPAQAASEQPAVFSSQPRPSEPPPKPVESRKLPADHQEAYDLAEEAMRNQRFEEAEHFYRAAADFENLGADEAAMYAKGMREARHARLFQQAMAERRASGAFRDYLRKADAALEDWTKAELDEVQKLKLEDLPLVSGQLGEAETTAAPLLIKNSSGEPIGLWKPAAPPPWSLQGMPEDGNLIAEVFMSRLLKKAGLRCPAAAACTLQSARGPVRGVLIRWVPGVRKLQHVTAGARAALANQVAPYRAASIVGGNYDIHMGNFVYDQVGRVWHLDHGLAHLKTPPHAMKEVREWMRMPGYRLSGDDPIDFAKICRDEYTTYRIEPPGSTGTPQAGGGQPHTGRVGIEAQAQFYKVEVARMDQLLRGEDMRSTAEKLKTLTDLEIEEMLKDVLTRGSSAEVQAEIDAIKAAIKARAGKLDILLDKWPGARPTQTTGRGPQPPHKDYRRDVSAS